MNKISRIKITKAELLAELERCYQRLVELEAKEVDRQKEQELILETVQKYRIVLDNSSDPIFSFLPDGTYYFVNKAFADGVNRKLEQILNHKIWDVFPKDEADKRYAAVKWVLENKDTRVIEVRVPREDGDRYYITTAKPIFNDQGSVSSVICISKEITERKHMEQDLQRLSTHDILTGLYNRNYFEVELARLQVSRFFPISIVVADMDNLKTVNDCYGHSAGDSLIRKVAQALRYSFRAEDIIARIGGDEFVALLPTTREDAAESSVTRLRAVIDQQADPLLRLSIGVATGQEGTYLPEIMRLADDRMYQDKRSHRSLVSSTRGIEE